MKRIRGVLFIFMAVALSGLSLYNGYHFIYLTVGIEIAIIFTVVIELSRLTFLYVSKKNRVFYLLYGLIVLVAVGSNLLSYVTKQIELDQINDADLIQQAETIRLKASDQIKIRLNELDKFSLRARSKGWPDAIKIWDDKIANLEKERADLITEKVEPENLKKWLQKNRALYGIEGQNLEDKNFVKTALAGFGITVKTAQIVQGIIMTVAIEILIVVFFSLGFRKEKEITIPEPIAAETKKTSSPVPVETFGFNEETIQGAAAKFKEITDSGRGVTGSDVGGDFRVILRRISNSAVLDFIKNNGE